jgi:hypothetical protein
MAFGSLLDYPTFPRRPGGKKPFKRATRTQPRTACGVTLLAAAMVGAGANPSSTASK